MVEEENDDIDGPKWCLYDIGTTLTWTIAENDFTSCSYDKINRCFRAAIEKYQWKTLHFEFVPYTSHTRRTDSLPSAHVVIRGANCDTFCISSCCPPYSGELRVTRHFVKLTEARMIQLFIMHLRQISGFKGIEENQLITNFDHLRCKPILRSNKI